MPSKWNAVPEEDRNAIRKLIDDHDRAIKARQEAYAKRENPDPILTRAFIRRRIACKLALQRLETND